MTMSYSRSRATFFLSTTLLLLLSVITVILYSLAVAFISSPIVDLSQVINFDRQSFPVLEVLPQNLNSASSTLALASGVISLVVSLTCVVFAVLFWPDNKRIYLICPITSLSYALLSNALLSLLAMIYLQVAYLQSSIFDPTYRGPYGLYDRGTFDFESWACQVSGHKNNFPSRQCSSARAGRVADIICCITAIVTTVIGTRALRGERDAIKRAENEKRNRKNFWLHGSASSNDIEMD